MALSERDSNWLYPLLQVTQDKSTGRPGVSPQPGLELAHDLIGVDGSLEGGLRPFPGFKKVHEIDFSASQVANHDTSSEIQDVFPVSFAIGTSGYGYGFVYRVRRLRSAGSPPPGNSLTDGCDIFIDYYNSNTNTWTTKTFLVGNGSTLGVAVSRKTNAASGRQMSVTATGRWVFVFVEDREPVLFYVTEDLTTSTSGNNYTENVVGGPTESGPFPGPGKRPTNVPPDRSGNIGSQGRPTNFATMPGAGQVHLTNFAPHELGLGIGCGTSLSDTNSAGGESGSPSCWGTSGAPQDTGEIRYLEPGDYAFAYVLFDSTTGRRTALSAIAHARLEDFIPAAVTSAASADDAVPLYAAVEIAWDDAKYDQAYVYRSVKVQDAGGTFIASILHLDNIIDLADYETSNTLAGDWRQAIYYYELEDKSLVFQDVFLDNSLFDEVMPKGGASYMYENTMLVSKLLSGAASTTVENRDGDADIGLGEIRWSSLTRKSPELFSPENRYIPANLSSDIHTLHRAGPNVIGFSLDQQYHIRKESGYLRVHEVHEGFGVVNDKAADEVGSLIYFITAKGLKAVDSNAQLEDVKSINKPILNDWASNYEAISVSYDPDMSALFVLNSIQEEAYVFWFNTSMVTKLEDMVFDECVRGFWPRDHLFDGDLANPNSTYKNPLVERTVFVQNPPKVDLNPSQTTILFKHSLWVVDTGRTRIQKVGTDVGSTKYTLLDISGDTRFAVASDYTITSESTDAEVLTLTLHSGAILAGFYGAHVYVIEAADTSLIGNRAQVRHITGNDGLVLGNGAANLSGLVAGDRISISPIKVQWTGYPLNVQTEGGTPFSQIDDYFRVKHLDSVGCSFTDVQGVAATDGTTDARFRALAYHGDAAVEVGAAYPTARNGTPVVSVEDKESRYYAAFQNAGTALSGKFGVDGTVVTPAVQIICSDLDFRLLGVRVTGNIKASTRTRSTS